MYVCVFPHKLYITQRVASFPCFVRDEIGINIMLLLDANDGNYSIRL